MQRRLPAWACFDWWWLLVFTLVYAAIGIALGWKNRQPVYLPGWVPDLGIVWTAVQAYVVMGHRQRGWSICLFLLAAAVETANFFWPIGWKGEFLGFLSWGFAFAGLLVLWYEFDRLFVEESQPQARLNGWLVVFLSFYYFQYKLHEVYEDEQARASGMPRSRERHEAQGSAS